MEKKTVILAVVGLGIGIASIFLFKRYIPKMIGQKKEDDLEEDTDTSSSPTSTAEKPNDDYPLKIGSKGNNVKSAQRILNKLVAYNYLKKRGKKLNKNVVAEDGDFGSGTEKAFDKYLGTKVVTKMGLQQIQYKLKKG